MRFEPGQEVHLTFKADELIVSVDGVFVGARLDGNFGGPEMLFRGDVAVWTTNEEKIERRRVRRRPPMTGAPG